MNMISPVAAIFVSLVATGCASFQPATPEGYTGPTATIRDTAISKTGSLAHMFYIARVDDRELRDAWVATNSANHGRGFSVSPVTLVHTVPARPTKLTIKGYTYYAAPILAMVNPTCSVEGMIDADLHEGNTYIVKGTLTSESCSVWVETEPGAQLVGQKITGPGTK